MGNGKAGAMAGADAATNWMSAQIGQFASGDPSGSWLAGPPLGKTPPDPMAITEVAEAGARL
jgi:hypothetical protein